MVAPRRAQIVTRPVDRRVHDHVGWCFDGPDDWDRVVTDYFAEGLAAGDRVRWVVEEPDPGRLDGLGDVEALVARGALEVVPVSLAYGPVAELDWRDAPARIAAGAARARADGYRWVRSAVDVTSLVTAPGGFERWLRWEAAADRGIAANPAIGLCGYDRRRTGGAMLADLAAVHSVACAGHGPVFFQLFTDTDTDTDTGGDAVRLSGAVDGLSADRFGRLLACVGDGGRLIVDVSEAEFLNHSALLALHRLAVGGAEVVVRRSRPVHGAVWHLLGLAPSAMRFEEDDPITP